MATNTKRQLGFRGATRAAAIHLGLSAVIAMLVAGLVFTRWFPTPFQDLAGGVHLFIILIAADLVCGPLLTLLVFNNTKSRRELTFDLSLVALIQIGALVYGLYSISLARPVALAFEVDRFVAVAAAEIDEQSLREAQPEWRQLPWWNGPYLVGTRLPKSADEKLKNLNLSLQGVEPSARPDWWQSYTDSLSDIKKSMRSVALIINSATESEQKDLNKIISTNKFDIDKLFYLPLTSKKKLDSWIVLLNQEGQIVGYAPIDGFKDINSTHQDKAS